MILDANEIGAGAALHADLCIVGAGPAGIAIALACAASGMAVLLLESGGLRPDAQGQALCRGEVADGAAHPPPHLFRRRGLGGCSTIWGGRCVPFDRQDFAARPWLGLSAPWPIAYETLVPYWRDAASLLEIGAPDFDARTAIAGGMKPMLPGFAHPHVSTDTIERFSPPADLGRRHEAALRDSRAILVLLHATCTGIVLEDNHARVRELAIRARGGAALLVRARHVVLAAGGLEVPRLLLASNGQLPSGIGNAHDQVGRHYMTHLAGTSCVFTPSPGRVPFHGYERDADGIYCRRRFSITEAAQRAMGIGNAVARLHHPRPADPAHRSGPLSALSLASRLVAREYRGAAGGAQEGFGLARTLRHVANVARDAPATASFAGHVLRDRVLARRKFPSIIVQPPSGRFTLDIHAEQLPDRESRITLGRDRDRFGTPVPRIDWRPGAEDLRTVRVTVSLIAEALASGGHGTLEYDPAGLDADMTAAGAYGGHHLGGARMSASPGTGVVNGDCRVHGISNLYIAGGAVLPTSGQANPTLTIVALALRLAAHLGGKARTAAPMAAPALMDA